MGLMMQPRRVLLPAVAVVLLAACSDPQPTPPAPSASEAPPRTPLASRFAAASATPVASNAPSTEPSLPPIADDPPSIGLEAVGVGFDAPIGIADAPGGWLLVNERNGRVIALDPASGETAVTVDLTDRVLGGGEQGLLGLALHPDWPDEPRAFVHYTNLDGNTVVAELAGSQEGGGAPTLDAGSERVFLRVDQPYTNHNGGQLAFGPDGFLYLGLGDGGSGGDPHGNGQNPDQLLGKILRFDMDSGDPYGVPEGNPFADGEGGAPEVFLIGLRNPWRFSFDAATGLLWIADVGQNAFEEISRVDPGADAGANLGWSRLEASHCYQSGCSPDGTVLPVAEYGHDAGCSVSGGHVYRGEALPDLRGWYLFSDYCSGLLFGLRSDATGVNVPPVLLETGLNVSAFGEDGDGELYLADIGGGQVYRVVPGD